MLYNSIIFRLNKTLGPLVLRCHLYEIDEVESEMFTVVIVVFHDCTRPKWMAALNEVCIHSELFSKSIK